MISKFLTHLNSENESKSSELVEQLGELKQGGGANKKEDEEDKNGTSEGERFIDDPVGTREKLTRRLRHCSNKKYRAPFVYLLGFLLFIAVIVIIVLSVKLSQKAPVCPLDVSSCPPYWLKYGRSCYYLSKTERTWGSSQSNCSSYGASLAAIDSQQEMDFLLREKAHTDYWIGLRREEGQPWKWPNGSVFSNRFRIRANGQCAYLDDDGASSTWCHTQRNWICSKSLHVP